MGINHEAARQAWGLDRGRARSGTGHRGRHRQRRPAHHDPDSGRANRGQGCARSDQDGIQDRHQKRPRANGHQDQDGYVPASQGPAGTTIAGYSGSGNENTGSFSVPSSGDYVVSWSYYDNTDPSIGGGTNFTISATNSAGMTGNYPNDIQSSGSGSTEDTGISGTQSFNVQATGHWDITVKSAS